MTKHVTIKISEDESESSDQKIYEIISGISDENIKDILSLPTLYKWPKGKMKSTERAMVLLRAGLEALQNAKKSEPLPAKLGATPVSKDPSNSWMKNAF